MSAYAPAAIKACFDTVKKSIPSAQLSGIYANKPGYHNARQNLPGSDYSVQRSADKKGDAAAAGALDITLSTADMKKVTQRLIDATKKGDTRLRALREFFGTVNGTSVTGMDVPGKYYVTSDPSHLWHVHASGNRSHANDTAAWQDVAAVMLGSSSSGGGGSTPPPEVIDMPKELYLYTAGRTTKIPKSKWVPLKFDKWSPSNASGNTSAVLPDAATAFSLSIDVVLANLPPSSNVYFRIQTLDRNGKQLALFPVAEQVGTTGTTGLSYSHIGTVKKKTNLRVLMSSTIDVDVTSAVWRVFYW